MSTGKELARTISCGNWKEIKKRYNIVDYQIFDSGGKKITPKQAETETFCHLRVLIKDKDMSDREAWILGEFLRNIASTSSEAMSLEIQSTYGFTEIIIC